jgi:hypothetical protein
MQTSVSIRLHQKVCTDTLECQARGHAFLHDGSDEVAATAGVPSISLVVASSAFAAGVFNFEAAALSFAAVLGDFSF